MVTPHTYTIVVLKHVFLSFKVDLLQLDKKI